MIEYVVDGANRRVGKKVNGALATSWLYGDNIRIVAAVDSASGISTQFVYGTRGNAPDYMVREGVTYRILTDNRGSPRLVVNSATGAIAQRLEYDTFGNVLFDSNPGFQPFGHAGGLYDVDTGFVHFGVRDYDPRTGRWTTKEPLGFAGADTNFYVYALSDPINYLDPDGLQVAAANHPEERSRTFVGDMSDPRIKQMWDGGVAPDFYFPKGTPDHLKQECVSLTKEFTGAPCTACWRQGDKVAGNGTIPYLTAIAAGWKANGQYPRGPKDVKLPRNSGLYAGEDASGVWIIDQYPRDSEGLPHKATPRRLPFDGGWPSNNGDAYYVITAPPRCGCN